MNEILLGYDDVMAKLNTLMSFTFRERLLRKGLRAAGNFLEERMRSRAPDYTGNLRESITNSVIQITASSGTVRVGPSKKAWYAHFIEFGTAGHAINRRKAKVLADVYGTFYGVSVEHPGTKAQPFMRPTLDQDKDAAKAEFARVVWEAIKEAVGA